MNGPIEGPVKVTVQLRDSDPVTYTATRMPWEWRSFLVIAQANNEDRLTYIPMSNVDTFDVEQLRTQRRPQLAFSE